MASDFDEYLETIFDKSLSAWCGSLGDNDNNVSVYTSGSGLNIYPLDLHTECSIGHFNCVRTVVESKKIPLDFKNRGGWTPLMYACHTGHEDIVNLLLQAGVSVNSVNEKYVSPLMLAASCGNEEIAHRLIEQGAAIDSRNDKGWTALYYATLSGHHNVVKLLLDNGCSTGISDTINKMTPLMEAASAGHEMIVLYFLQKGDNLKAVNKAGHTALTLAMMKGHSKIVSIIKEYTHDHIYAKTVSDQAISEKKNTITSVITEGPEMIHHLIKKKLALQGNVAESKHSRDTNPQTSLAQINDQFPCSPSAAQQQHKYFLQQFQHQANCPPMNLHQLLAELGLSKYSSVFQEQDVDLSVFLTLTDNDLKEIGVNLLGPRKKMMMAITRWHNNSSVAVHNQSQVAPQNDLQKVIISLHQKIQQLQQQLQREEQLRVTVETCLMRDRSLRQELVDRLFQHINRFSTRKDILLSNIKGSIRDLEHFMKFPSGNDMDMHKGLENYSCKLKRCCTDLETLLHAICGDTHSILSSIQNSSSSTQTQQMDPI